MEKVTIASFVLGGAFPLPPELESGWAKTYASSLLSAMDSDSVLACCSYCDGDGWVSAWG
jgi:hypothetical protein